MHKLQFSVEAGDVLLAEVLVESFQRMVSQAKNTTCVACVLQMIICPAFIIVLPWPWLRNTMSLLEKPLSLEVQRLSLPKMVAGKNLADCKSIRTVDSLLLWQAAQTKVPTESCQQDQGVHYEKAVAVSALVAPSWLVSLVDGSWSNIHLRSPAQPHPTSFLAAKLWLHRWTNESINFVFLPQRPLSDKLQEN